MFPLGNSPPFYDACARPFMGLVEINPDVAPVLFVLIPRDLCRAVESVST